MTVEIQGRVNAGTLARVLHAADVVNYQPTTAGGDCFIGVQPDAPGLDACVTVIGLGGSTPRLDASRWDVDEDFRIIVRGAKGDIVGPRERSELVVAALIDLAGSTPVRAATGTLDEGTILQVFPGAAANAGYDPQGRVEWVVRVSVRSTGWHRAAL